MNIVTLDDLGRRWREEAAQLRIRGIEREARMLESLVEDFEETLRSWQLEALTLEQAVEESGFKYSTLQQSVAAGDIPNAGEKGSPRIRRCDLPTRGGRHLRDDSGPDLAARILTA